MSSVIRDAGEKDNKTCLSTTDNGTFFIIKKYATFARGTFLAFYGCLLTTLLVLTEQLFIFLFVF